MTSLRPLLLVRRIEQHRHQQKRQLRTLVTLLNTEINNSIIEQKQQRHTRIQTEFSIVGIRSLASSPGNASTASISSPPSRVDHRINNLDNPLLRKALIHGQQQQRYHRMSSSLSFVGKNYITKKYFHSSTSRLLNASAAEAPPATDTIADADTAGETKAAMSNNDDGEYEYQDMNEIDWAFTPAPPLSEESQKKVDKIFNEILWLDMVEVHLLTEVVNEKMGYGGMDLGGGGGDFDMMAGGAVAGSEEEAKEEKTIFELKLVGFDAKAKIKVIKEIRTITGLGLKEAKEMVESAPKVVQKDLKKDKAEELKAQLEAIGAQVEIE